MTTKAEVRKLYDAGAHMALPRTRRHPSALTFIFGTKERTDVFNLEETHKRLQTAEAFVRELGKSGKLVVFVGGKNEVVAIVKNVAERVGVPYVAGRWIGGTLTNFKNIRKRVDRLERLTKERDAGELDKYTKRERLTISREIEELEGRFGGITSMKDIPAALFIVDTRHEDTAVREANQLHIPVIGLASSDCDFSLIQYPIPANDTSIKSVQLVAEMIADAYQEGKRPVQK